RLSETLLDHQPLGRFPIAECTTGRSPHRPQSTSRSATRLNGDSLPTGFPDPPLISSTAVLPFTTADLPSAEISGRSKLYSLLDQFCTTSCVVRSIAWTAVVSVTSATPALDMKSTA